MGRLRDLANASLQAECASLRVALSESLRLQSHYATLLNQYDGGQRMTFPTIGAWLARLEAVSPSVGEAPGSRAEVPAPSAEHKTSAERSRRGGGPGETVPTE